MELIHGSETSAYHILTPGKCPKEHIQYSNHGESLKSTVRNTVNTGTHNACRALMRSRALNRSSKLKIYKTLIRPVVTYGSEAWTLTLKNLN